MKHTDNAADHREDARSALAELIELKRIKDTYGHSRPDSPSSPMWKQYLIDVDHFASREEIAWERAAAALGVQPPPEPTKFDAEDVNTLVGYLTERCGEVMPQPPTTTELSALLPGAYYMDPPDGGDVSLLEQLRRMARDAERYRLQAGEPLVVPPPPPDPQNPVAFINDKVLAGMHADHRYGICAPVPTEGGSTIPLYAAPVDLAGASSREAVPRPPTPPSYTEPCPVVVPPVAQFQIRFKAKECVWTDCQDERDYRKALESGLYEGRPLYALQVPPAPPDWNIASKAMLHLNDIEALQGGANGPTIQLRATLLALVDLAGASSRGGVPVAWLVTWPDGDQDLRWIKPEYDSDYYPNGPARVDPLYALQVPPPDPPKTSDVDSTELRG